MKLGGTTEQAPRPNRKGGLFVWLPFIRSPLGMTLMHNGLPIASRRSTFGLNWTTNAI